MTRKHALTLRLPPDLYERIRDAAGEDRRSVTAWIRLACEDKMDGDDRAETWAKRLADHAVMVVSEPRRTARWEPLYHTLIVLADAYARIREDRP